MPNPRNGGGRSCPDYRSAARQVPMAQRAFAECYSHLGFHFDAFYPSAPDLHAPAAERDFGCTNHRTYHTLSSSPRCNRPERAGHRLGRSSETVRGEGSRAQQAHLVRLPRARR